MEDSELTPHVLVNCAYPGVNVPEKFIQQDKIVLNIASHATSGLVISNDSISFKARFSGQSVDIFIPVDALISIYAGENGEGMFFGSDDTIPEEDAKPPLTLLD